MTTSKSVKPHTPHPTPHTPHPTPCPQEKLFAANPNYDLYSPSRHHPPSPYLCRSHGERYSYPRDG
ncbi:MAG: hypothetical protein EWV63_12090 [Microcystis aeruginosa Ma_OC_H_19870700_S124]|uniref:Uncharacterized protein n=1 Tax=Microcystis aeruginosa Ma_OC_H_19870700_S124 TaxID=2486262 RepID=A0A552AKB6_MICAE|nr:MAG: hypothetical protein EWV63_12090 [Microcystis aeruginosa Ma_OC_H_19870700_S124]